MFWYKKKSLLAWKSSYEKHEYEDMKAVKIRNSTKHVQRSAKRGKIFNSNK